LFSDIVGSSDRAHALGDQAWMALLEQHRALIRQEFRRFRGREIGTTGDGFLATFDGPARAVHCARAIVATTQAIGVEIRVGVHTGEIELRGDDIGGIAVHTGARVASSAGPSQVLVTGTVRDLVAGSGIDFEDQGDFALKGIPGTWRLFAVRSA
jgi:class 3 adenylate cyclase